MAKQEIIYQNERLEVLELLVDELMKESPAEERIKEFMNKTGLDYVSDPIERINSVLKALHFQEPESE